MSQQRRTKDAFSSCDSVYLGWPNVYTEAFPPPTHALYSVYWAQYNTLDVPVRGGETSRDGHAEISVQVLISLPQRHV